ncbi:RHS repeat domain-containing protein [Calditrichota bacterium GD2]
MNDGQSNHGFLWILNPEQKWRSVFAASSDYTNPTKRPKLVVIYQPMKKYFYLKDHLGNIRVTVDENGEVKEYNDYYPFGLRMPGRSMNTALNYVLYKFSGKELDEESGINWYYFGARYYDPVIGRFNTVDPKWYLRVWESPYAYTGNNPINRIEIKGLYWIKSSKGKVVAYSYPLYASIIMEIPSFFPFGGILTNSVKRFGFGDYTVSNASWASSILPFKKYKSLITSIFWGASNFDDYRQWNWDKKTFSLAVKLGYAENISTGGMNAIVLNKLLKKLIAENKNLTKKRLLEKLKKELSTIQDFYKLTKEEFIKLHGKETYEDYKQADIKNNDSWEKEWDEEWAPWN